MISGLLIAGQLYAVPGLTIVPPASHGGPAWCTLDPGDYRQRRTRWVRQVVLHTTKGMWPQHVKPGAGPSGRDRRVADFWHRDPVHSAAHLVIDSDGSVACLADLARVHAYHATVSNDWSVGIELYHEADGGIYEAVYDAAVRLVPALCNALGIPFQVIADPYDGFPLERLLDGGPDVVGVYGHRSNTARRGRGDPGDEVFARLVAAGAEPVTISDRQDLEIGAARQRALNELDACAGNTYRR